MSASTPTALTIRTAPISQIEPQPRLRKIKAPIRKEKAGEAQPGRAALISL
jgi:hypothetical protein